MKIYFLIVHMLSNKTWKSEGSAVSLIENHTLAFASEKKVHWSFIERLSFTIQKRTNSWILRILLSSPVLNSVQVFPWRMLCKLIYIIFSILPTSSLSPFIYIRSKSMGVVSLLLTTGQMWGCREIFQKCQLHTACYDLTGHINHPCNLKAVLVSV